ncbi:MAG TPA: MarR family winged helix-turn-helix transcriptional regulator [Pirellulales bacterium]|nr:MarR family winged helix-turn-helix transcriptional regulator [Pirellulales bacterium]
MPGSIREFDFEKLERMLRIGGCFALPAVARVLTRFYDELLEPVGLSAFELGILRVCGACGQTNAAGLARELAASQTTILRLAKRMLAAGFLRRLTGPKQRGLLELTAAGRRTLAEGIACWDQAQRHLMHCLGKERWNWLNGELSVIINLGPAAAVKEAPASNTSKSRREQTFPPERPRATARRADHVPQSRG